MDDFYAGVGWVTVLRESPAKEKKVREGHLQVSREERRNGKAERFSGPEIQAQIVQQRYIFIKKSKRKWNFQ